MPYHVACDTANRMQIALSSITPPHPSRTASRISVCVSDCWSAAQPVVASRACAAECRPRQGGLRHPFLRPRSHLLHVDARDGSVLVLLWIPPPRLLARVRERALCPIVTVLFAASRNLRHTTWQGGGADQRHDPNNVQKIIGIVENWAWQGYPLYVLIIFGGAVAVPAECETP